MIIRANITKGESSTFIPAPLSEELTAKIQKLCIDACTVADCRGVVRVDVMLSEEKYSICIGNKFSSRYDTDIFSSRCSKSCRHLFW